MESIEKPDPPNRKSALDQIKDDESHLSRFRQGMSREIFSERFVLRPIERNELEALHQLWIDERVRQFLWDGKTVSFEETAELVEKNQRLFNEFGFGIWGIHERLSPQLLGFAGYWYFRTPPSLELLFCVSSDHWNRGIATEAANCVIRYGFEGLDFQTIEASTNAANTASQRVIEKLGMSFRQRVEIDGLDTKFYTVRRDDWLRAANAFQRTSSARGRSVPETPKKATG